MGSPPHSYGADSRDSPEPRIKDTMTIDILTRAFVLTLIAAALTAVAPAESAWAGCAFPPAGDADSYRVGSVSCHGASARCRYRRLAVREIPSIEIMINVA